jgi:DNA-binding Lrp family transcriptional regulator
MDRPPPWTFLTNHAHVLLCLVAQPDIRMRDIAQKIGLTERWVQQIIRELAAAGYISRRRNGRRNEYLVHPQLPLRHPLESHRSVADMLELIQPPPEPERTPDPEAEVDEPDLPRTAATRERNVHA